MSKTNTSLSYLLFFWVNLINFMETFFFFFKHTNWLKLKKLNQSKSNKLYSNFSFPFNLVNLSSSCAAAISPTTTLCSFFSHRTTASQDTPPSPLHSKSSYPPVHKLSQVAATGVHHHHHHRSSHHQFLVINPNPTTHLCQQKGFLWPERDFSSLASDFYLANFLLFHFQSPFYFIFMF